MRRRMTVPALLLAACATAASAQDATLFRGVRVFDGERVIAATNVLVRDGVIAAIRANLTAPADATIVDGRGHTLLPGLIDAHTHVFGDALREALVFGVTTELDMFTESRSAQALRAEQRTNAASGRADIFSAGTLVTAPGGHGTQYGFTIPTLTTPDSAQAFVDARIAEGSDWIKIVFDDGRHFNLNWPTIDAATLRAAIAAAHRRDRLAVVHVSTAAAAAEAVRAGADGLVHLVTDAPLPDELIAEMARRNVFVIPTLTVLMSITGTSAGMALLEDERLLRFLSAGARTGLAQTFPPAPGRAAGYAFAVSSVKRLHDAGVRILAGTDAPNPGTAHGVSMHRELELLVDAGLTPVQALAAGTSVNADAFRVRDRGRIAAGQRADLLLVRGDPASDIRATREIAGIWKGGVRFDRDAYARTIAEAPPAGPAMAPRLVADFEAGTASAAFGTAWLPTTDSIVGGGSSGAMAVVAGGAGDSRHALAISGMIDGALPYAWSGAMWSPAAQPMQPGNLSGTAGVTFDVRGDGGTYRILVFSLTRAAMPAIQTFTAPAAWTEVVMPWTRLGIDPKDITAVMFVGGPQPGRFSFLVDNVRLH